MRIQRYERRTESYKVVATKLDSTRFRPHAITLQRRKLIISVVGASRNFIGCLHKAILGDAIQQGTRTLNWLIK